MTDYQAAQSQAISRPDTAFLSILRKGEHGEVVQLDEKDIATTLPPGELERRLIEMGVVEGARIEVMHEGFPNRDPIAIRVNEHTIALRRAEAHAVIVARRSR